MTGPGLRAPIRRIVVTVGVGRDLLAATDDPLFLELLGPAGREFRLQIAQGTALRRGSEDRFVLGAKSDPETNVANPELNDPTSPAIDAASVMGIALRKGLDPIPNVRGHGELDDRLQVLSVEVEPHVDGEAEPRRWSRSGDFWLGLVSGLRLSLAPLDESRAIRTAGFRIVGTMFAVFACVALVLAAAGLFGVLAFHVGQRTREIGVRRALGATRRSIVRLFFVETLIVVFGSGGIGLTLAYSLWGLFNLLPPVPYFAGLLPTWQSGLLSFLLLSAVALLAALYPARRAAAVDPIAALRFEAGG